MKRTLIERIRAKIPRSVKSVVAPLRNVVVNKGTSEMAYWRGRHASEGRKFENDHYGRLMLAMANEPSGSFLDGRVIADFGCGPRGSLQWATNASYRIGIDVLAARYAMEFPEVATHGMIYVNSSEDTIPMPDDTVDVMFTMNALDHAAHLDRMCGEIIRILKPGGEFVASFNLNEPPTAAEPQTLTEEILFDLLLRHFRQHSLRLGRPISPDDYYSEMFSGTSTYRTGQPGYMWYRGTLLG